MKMELEHLGSGDSPIRFDGHTYIAADITLSISVPLLEASGRLSLRITFWSRRSNTQSLLLA